MRRSTVIAMSTLVLATSVASAKAEEVSRFQLLAIGAGAIVGVIAANVISGGMITPVLTGAAFGLPADGAGASAALGGATTAIEGATAAIEGAVTSTAAAQAAIIIVGGTVGAVVGSWLAGG
jgi:hypothetical protein